MRDLGKVIPVQRLNSWLSALDSLYALAKKKKAAESEAQQQPGDLHENKS